MNLKTQIETALALVPVDTNDSLVCALRNQLIECQSAIDATTAPLHATIAELRRELEEAVRAFDKAGAAIGSYTDWAATPREDLLANAITDPPSEWVPRAELEEWKRVRPTRGDLKALETANEALRTALRECREGLTAAEEYMQANTPANSYGLRDREADAERVAALEIVCAALTSTQHLEQ